MLRYPDPMSFSVQHVKSVIDYPHLAWDPANCRSAHLVHNKRAGKGGVLTPDVGPTSEDW